MDGEVRGFLPPSSLPSPVEGISPDMLQDLNKRKSVSDNVQQVNGIKSVVQTFTCVHRERKCRLHCKCVHVHVHRGNIFGFSLYSCGKICNMPVHIIDGVRFFS